MARKSQARSKAASKPVAGPQEGAGRESLARWAPFDLLGDPIPENWASRGRPPHIPTARNRVKVRLLLAEGRTKVYIARALRITKETLTKHYFVELRQRAEARPALEAELFMRNWELAQAGNVGALKLLFQRFEKLDLVVPPAREPEAKPEKLGKKEAADRTAQTAHEESGWGPLLH
ncbi:MAG TPA: hypothetical protein VGA50_04505 [Kiloniellales bacterium]